ncbi:MAG: DMT family transporter [Candidatus Cloacimonetes bacterium]|nr:DMT family transporter [Candidatus Cloacimonadota bacterium]MCF7813349.1 DMT family transporter [Candidatus Cloacimonadota bacterium]MCF7867838.1 DMT family transporter [Candidatus Cloacimonadota bacterium]MCF7883276.1 DMT family transporter [Candidatus Cloacimonadota bacterium]
MENKKKAVILMLASSLAFACSAAAVKLSGDLPVFEKVFFRNILAVVIAYITIRKQKQPLFGKKENQKYLLVRSFLGVIGMVLYFYAISNLYLADSAMLHKLFPFFVTVFAAIFLKEKLSKIQIPALFIVFLAALLIIKPRFDYTIFPALAGLGTAIVSGGTYTLVRFLRNREKPATIVFYFSFVSLVTLAPFVLFDYQPPTPIQWFYLLLIGIFAAIGQFTLTYAYRYGQASEIAIYNYTNIIFAGVIGFLIWQEIPDYLSLIGGIIIIAASIVVFAYNSRQNK